MMLARGLRPALRAVRTSTQYHGRRTQTGSNGRHKTYFQDPPPPPPPAKSGRGRYIVVAGVTMATVCYLYYPTFIAKGMAVIAAQEQTLAFQKAGAIDVVARHVPVMTYERAQATLNLSALTAVTPATLTHICQLASNMPCEDTYASTAVADGPNIPPAWTGWAIFDGHAGPSTATMLAGTLLPALLAELHQEGNSNRGYIPNDDRLLRIIKGRFQSLDDRVLERGKQAALNSDQRLTEKIQAATLASSGSCALVALLDSTHSVLRVANVGDSRAVLGRWDDAAGKYIARLMSEDQTGFNQREVERIRREHPGEDPVDPQTGRVHGLAVTRAFGDSRWKWPQELTKMVHEQLWRPAPRPEGLIKTPPYLTAEPEIMETKVRTDGDHPDFLIMASDGLWDNISSEDAVTCVQYWLDKFKPSDALPRRQDGNMTSSLCTLREDDHSRITATVPTAAATPDGNDDTYWSETERALKWRVSPKHFIVEDTNCGSHLIKNVLGGNRRDLFLGAMTVQPPYSRNMRDDITVQVVFFGAGMEQKEVQRLHLTKR